MFQVGTEKITVYQKKTVESAKKLVRDTLPSGFDIHIQISQKKTCTSSKKRNHKFCSKPQAEPI